MLYLTCTHVSFSHQVLLDLSCVLCLFWVVGEQPLHCLLKDNHPWSVSEGLCVMRRLDLSNCLIGLVAQAFPRGSGGLIGLAATHVTVGIGMCLVVLLSLCNALPAFEVVGVL